MIFFFLIKTEGWVFEHKWGMSSETALWLGSPNLWGFGSFWGSHQAGGRGVTCPGSGTAPRLVAAHLEAPAAQTSL